MQVNKQWMQQWFTIFNNDYFDGGLPMPKLALSRSRTRLGSMSCKRSTRFLCSKYTDFSIHISNYYDQTERQFQNVLLHEMIHYSIAYNKIKDTSAHGVVFRGMMDSLNSTYGWEISVTSSTKNVNVSPSVQSSQHRERLILAIEMSDGRCLLSVVNARYARAIDRQMSIAEIKRYGWYTTTDDYFAQYPAVRTPKGRIVTKEIYDAKMSEMKSVSL